MRDWEETEPEKSRQDWVENERLDWMENERLDWMENERPGSRNDKTTRSRGEDEGLCRDKDGSTRAETAVSGVCRMETERTRAEVYFYSLEEGLPSYLREMEEEAYREHVPILRPAARSLLRFVIQKERPAHILEVGTAVGFSALLMEEYAKNCASITTIEKVPLRIKTAERHFAQYDPEGKISLIAGDAAEILPALVKEEEGSYDLIFMDAAKGQYPAFLPFIVRLLREGGSLISDNILQEGMLLESRFVTPHRDRTIHDRMRDYVRTITHHPELNTLLLFMGDGLSWSVKRRKE